MHTREKLLDLGFVDVPNHRGHYMVNKIGQVCSMPRKKEYTNGVIGRTKGRIMKNWTSVHGYKMVTLSSPKKKHYSIHRLIARCFIPNPNNYPEIDHIDGNPLNNTLSNLRWCTHSQNINNPIRIKRCSDTHRKISREPWHKPVCQISLDGKVIATFGSVKEAAEKTNSQRPHISHVLKGDRKVHNGYKWRYADK